MRKDIIIENITKIEGNAGLKVIVEDDTVKEVQLRHGQGSAINDQGLPAVFYGGG